MDLESTVACVLIPLESLSVNISHRRVGNSNGWYEYSIVSSSDESRLDISLSSRPYITPVQVRMTGPVIYQEINSPYWIMVLGIRELADSALLKEKDRNPVPVIFPFREGPKATVPHHSGGLNDWVFRKHSYDWAVAMTT